MNTTLNQIREKSPCADGWEKLLKSLNKTKADDEPLSIITILDSNGLDDAIWCLQAVTGRDREIRLYAVWCARQVQHLMTDKRSLDAMDVAERFANGLATADDLAAAEEAATTARAAARAAAWSADATMAAARAAAWSAAWAAAWSADATMAATRIAEWSAAWAAARSAAGAAARSAARSAAGAAMAAGAAKWAADAARAAAGDAARVAQEKRLREVCAEIDAAIVETNLKEKNA